MSEQTILEIETTTTDIVVAVTKNPGLVLLDEEKYNVWYEKLKAKAPTATDMTIRKDREAVRSFAAEVRSEKAAIDKARLRMTKEWRDMVSQANTVGKVIETQLESLAVEVRAPLTAWEDAENTRLAECRDTIARIKMAAHVTIHDSAADVRQRGMDVWNATLDPEKFGEMLEEAQGAKDEAVTALKAALVRLTQEESDRAELDRLRQAETDRLERDRIAEEARVASERQAEEARQAEERRIAAEQAEAERLARVQQEAAEKAKREADEAAQAERDRVQREHDEALAAERKRAEQAEADAQAQRDKVAEQARIADGERVAAEARENDRKHRAKIMGEAKTDIMSCGVDEETARKIVLAIVGGNVLHVTLRF